MCVGGIGGDSQQPSTGPTEDELNRLAAEVFEATGEQIFNNDFYIIFDWDI